MGKKIIWSKQAKNQRKIILEYWIKRNQSYTYSEKLNRLFGLAVNTISEFPKSGRQTEFDKIRMILIRDYKLFYNINISSIEIIALIDMRRDPKFINKILNK